MTLRCTDLRWRYGDTSVAWRVEDDGELRVEVVVPPNTSATITLPGKDAVRVRSGAHSF